MRWVLIGILSLMWELAQAQDANNHSDPAAEARKTTFILCLRGAIRSLDDGVSPASDIALGVQGYCNNELRAIGGVYAKLPPQHISELVRIIAIEQTLSVRAEARKKATSR